VDGGHADSLCNVTFPNAGVAEQQNVLTLLGKTAAGKLENQCPVDSVKFPVEGIERFMVAETGRFDAAADKPIPSFLQFVVNEEADEIQWSEVFGSGLLRSQRERIGHAAEP